MSYGGHLRTLRGEAGLSRAELARRAGVPVSTLRIWEDGRGFPGAPALLRLAEALGCRRSGWPRGWMTRQRTRHRYRHDERG